MFANQEYEQLFELAANELKDISPEVLAARFKERFQEPSLPDMEGRFSARGQRRGGERR